MLTKTRAAKNPTVHLTETDFEILSSLVGAVSPEFPGAALLARELDRAVVVRDDGAASRKLVQLNSRVEFEDVATGQVREMQICLPRDASIDDHRISVLTPVGAALIGMRVGQTFAWMDAGGRTRTLKVLAVQDDVR